jgi:hypothetical protein
MIESNPTIQTTTLTHPRPIGGFATDIRHIPRAQEMLKAEHML